MDTLKIIEKYYTPGTPLYETLLNHSRSVTEKALKIAKAHPELKADLKFIEEAAMLHDIGIFMTDAPGIGCTGTYPYICHGILGSELLQKEGYPEHALVCERHTGTGLSAEDIILRNLPIPHRDMLPVSIEEQIICYADKFFSKSGSGKEKDTERIRKGLSKFGESTLGRFDRWNNIFLI